MARPRPVPSVSLALAVLLVAPACSDSAPEAPPTDAQESTPPPEQAAEQAPARFRVRFDTTKGPFVAEFHRDWSPRGVDRLYEMVKGDFFAEIAAFRVIDGFVAQFGIHGDPEQAAKWRDRVIADDPVLQKNLRGTITFATGGPNTRTTQLFINLADNSAALDGQGFSPIGKVVLGMDNVDRFFKGYGDGPPRGNAPDQERIQSEGNAFLKRDYPNLDWIKGARVVE